ncbi:unnamed protein product [Paramecium primaurelia]|uniref:Uncharacterized protein n=1 Tax=Paramecium primaurelia TaxID=5886 RepID=A0A8S1LER4_PARPR|nr:unnamed protein product [Paramecium primaurelia]
MKIQKKIQLTNQIQQRWKKKNAQNLLKDEIKGLQDEIQYFQSKTSKHKKIKQLAENFTYQLSQQKQENM